jgi:hypothetical protein
MKYIILGKALNKGTVNNDSSDLSVYFELGWEVVGSRMDIIKLINNNTIDTENTTLVTVEDRKFMYEKFYKKVISYEKFLNVKTPMDTVLDWTIDRNFSFLDAYSDYVDVTTKKYKYFDRDFEMIFNGFNLTNSIFPNNQDSKFVVLALRYRDHNRHKNADESFFKKMVKEIKEKITKNIYIVGYGSEKFSDENDCIYVNKLVDFVNLIKHKNCISLISQSTGTVCLSFLCSVAPIHLLDHTSCSEINGDNAVLGGKCIHFFQNGMTPHYDLTNNTLNKIITSLKF